MIITLYQQPSKTWQLNTCSSWLGEDILISKYSFTNNKFSILKVSTLQIPVSPRLDCHLWISYRSVQSHRLWPGVGLGSTSSIWIADLISPDLKSRASHLRIISSLVTASSATANKWAFITNCQISVLSPHSRLELSFPVSRLELSFPPSVHTQLVSQIRKSTGEYRDGIFTLCLLEFNKRIQQIARQPVSQIAAGGE